MNNLFMKIYVSHSKKFNFKDELYKPLRESDLNQTHQIILPHEESNKPYNSKEEMKTFDLILAEVSYPATGLGIELGWADALNIQIIVLYKEDSKIPSSVQVLTNNIIRYSTPEEMISKISSVLETFS